VEPRGTVEPRGAVEPGTDRMDRMDRMAWEVMHL
jgi:hypothetical protein